MTSAGNGSSVGPGWAPHTLDVRGGRFPLSVEAHLMNMTARLVPGATTVTTSPRYYTLHGAVAAEAARRSLDPEAAVGLLRRCEVVLAAASIVHPSPTSGTVHGQESVLARSGGALFDLADLSSRYSQARSGFLGPYLGSELTLGILADGTLTPGKRLPSAPLASSFEGLFELAAKREITASDLRACPHLSVGAAASSDDGAWLAQQLVGVDLPDPIDADRARAGTARLLIRAMEHSSHSHPAAALRELVAYGPALREDPVVTAVAEAEPWRGTFFRHDSVGAWRRIWAWLTEMIEGPTLKAELVEKLADSLPSATLASMDDELPPTTDRLGDPIDAEAIVRSNGGSVPAESLALLMLGARRARELSGFSRAAFVGNEGKVAVLSPLWTSSWLDSRRALHLRDIAADLTDVLLDRARRIALGKLRVSNGRLWLPSVVDERGDYLYTVGREGSGNVGLRLEQLTGLLRGLAVIETNGVVWQLGPRGEQLFRAGT